MIYTTYLNKLNKIPDGAKKIMISRKAPALETLKKYNCKHTTLFAPSNELKNEYLYGEMDFFEFEEKLLAEINSSSDKDTANRFNLLVMMGFWISQGVDIYLICYEKDSTKCHRQIIGNYLAERLNTKVEEIEL